MHSFRVTAFQTQWDVPSGLEIGIMNDPESFFHTTLKGKLQCAAPLSSLGTWTTPKPTELLFGMVGSALEISAVWKAGNMFVTGRIKEMINRGGEKIVPGEIDRP